MLLQGKKYCVQTSLKIQGRKLANQIKHEVYYKIRKCLFKKGIISFKARHGDKLSLAPHDYPPTITYGSYRNIIRTKVPISIVTKP